MKVEVEMQAEERPPESDEKWLEEVLTPINGLEEVLLNDLTVLSNLIPVRNALLDLAEVAVRADPLTREIMRLMAILKFQNWAEECPVSPERLVNAAFKTAKEC